MATIFNVQGYMAMKECLETIRKHVEVCAYKALCTAASPTHDQNDVSWYPTFLDEEREIAKKYDEAAGKKKKPAKPIPRRSINQQEGEQQTVEVDEAGFILNCSSLDMQAFMKIFFFRSAYRAKVVEAFNIEDEQEFKNVCKALMKYRNEDFAHVAVKEAEEELSKMTPEKEEEIINKCNESISKFFNFLRYFPQLGSESGDSPKQSFYDCACEKWRNTKTILLIEEVELDTIIQQEHLAVDVPTLIGICKECGVPVVIPDGKPYLITGDYKKTIKPICAMAQVLTQKNEHLQSKAEVERELERARLDAMSTQSKMANELELTRAAASDNRKQLITIIGLCVLFIGILVFLLFTLLGRDNSSMHNENPVPSESQQITPESTLASENQHSTTDTTTTDTPTYTGPAFISGSGAYAGLTFQINQMKAAGILINYTNDDQSDYSLGWVGGAQVDVKTSVGTFTVSTGSGNQKILKNSSGSFSVNLGQELTGQVLSITVRGIMPLSASGLPQGNDCSIEIPIKDGNPTAPDATPAKIIRGQASFGGMELTVDQKLSGGISVKYNNGDTNAFSLGWVGNAKVQIKTAKATIEGHVANSSFKIEKGAIGTFVIEVDGEISGAVQEIVIHNVNVLTEVGLPDFAQRDLTISIPITQSEE